MSQAFEEQSYAHPSPSQAHFLQAAGAPQPPPAVHSLLSPPSGVPNWQSKSVSEGVFECLHWEIIRYCTAQISTQIKSDDPKLLARRLHSKVESMGFGIGQRYVERYSRDHPFLEQPLDIVKFMCKEFWMLLFKKQIDKLQTNYKGIYVLHDLNFRWLQRIYALSPDVDAAALIDKSRVYTSLACGIIRGALCNLGLNASVKADINKLPAVQFTIMEEKAATASQATTLPQGNTTTGIRTNPTAAATTTVATAAPPSAAPSTTARPRTSISGTTGPNNRPGSAAPTAR